MNYGHALEFGVFITPRNDDPGAVVELARLAERVGLDLVTFQDHPYQPAFLDTWTLLSWVAGKTDRIRLAANVLNLPLRQPAVLARSVASLDRLAGGRVELGLGAGAFWDAIAAMGGRRLKPGEAVQALDEAMTIIREVWDGERRGGIYVDGTYYQVKGAKRGPSPAHAIPIWIGALGPRMLRLIGRRGDGWLPSLAYLKSLDDLAAGNTIIHEAAAIASRDPRAIRRMLNIGGQFAPPSDRFLVGPPEQWAEQLAIVTLTYGVSAYILASDDAAAIEVFARDVAPATREIVAAERARQGIVGDRVTAVTRSEGEAQ